MTYDPTHHWKRDDRTGVEVLHCPHYQTVAKASVARELSEKRCTVVCPACKRTLCLHVPAVAMRLKEAH